MKNISLVMFGIGLLIVSAFFLFLYSPVSIVYAATTNQQNLSASANVNAFIETSISGASVTFGNIDPGTADTAASSNPITLTNTGNSNTAIDVYLNATNMTSASYNINSSNISVWTANAAGSSKNFNASSFINYTTANTGFVENVAVSGTSDLYFWIDVNAAQQSGAYSGVIQIKVVADGASP